jgi:ribonuclease HI
MILACDGSYDHASGLAAWGVAMCRRPDRSSRGIESRAGIAPPSVATPHAAEAWAAHIALRWVRKLGLRSCVLVTDCAALHRLLRGEVTVGVEPGLLEDLVALGHGLRWELVGLEGRDPQAAIRRDLHQRCHRAAVATLRKRREVDAAR